MSQNWLAPALLALVLMAGAGCEDKHIGRPCDLLADGGTNKTTFNGSALECPTRICVQPALHPQNPETDTQALCTAECSSNDDCSEAEGRNKSKSGDRRCLSGFACAVASEVGEFCCKKLCLCKDFLPDAGGSFPIPESCRPGSGSICKNIR